MTEQGRAESANNPASLASTGEMGLPYAQVGSVVQSLARVLVDRGHDERFVRDAIARWAHRGYEPRFWSRLAEDVDALAGELGMASYPPDHSGDFPQMSPRSAAECERIMVEQHGSHCANPKEHPEP